MELFVYAVYLVGILAAFSVLVVRLYAALPPAVLARGAHAGRFADLGLASSAKRVTVRRLKSVDVPGARAA